jgi:hypothetical protein
LRRPGLSPDGDRVFRAATLLTPAAAGALAAALAWLAGERR